MTPALRTVAALLCAVLSAGFLFIGGRWAYLGFASGGGLALADFALLVFAIFFAGCTVDCLRARASPPPLNPSEQPNDNVMY